MLRFKVFREDASKGLLPRAEQDQSMVEEFEILRVAVVFRVWHAWLKVWGIRAREVGFSGLVLSVTQAIV